MSSPTAAALTRSGTSLVISETLRPSARRFSATTMIRLSLLSLRKPAGSTGVAVVELDVQRPAVVPDRHRRVEPPVRDPQVVEDAQRLPGEPAEFGVVALVLQFSDDDEREHHVGFTEAQQRTRVGEQDRSVEDERTASGHESTPVGRAARPRSKVAGPRRRGRIPAPLVDELVSTNRASRGRRGQLVIHRGR